MSTHNAYVLSFDEAEAIGLDGTGRDLDPRFPYEYHRLTDEEQNLFWQYRMAAVLTDGGSNGEELSLILRSIGNGLEQLLEFWYEHELPGDFIVPELGLPVSMAVEEAVMEVDHLANRISDASLELRYVGRHRKVDA